MLPNNNILVQKYKNVSKYKDLKIKIQKMCHLTSTTLLATVGALDMIKIQTDKHINKINEMQNITLSENDYLFMRILTM